MLKIFFSNIYASTWGSINTSCWCYMRVLRVIIIQYIPYESSIHFYHIHIVLVCSPKKWEKQRAKQRRAKSTRPPRGDVVVAVAVWNSTANYDNKDNTRMCTRTTRSRHCRCRLRSYIRNTIVSCLSRGIIRIANATSLPSAWRIRKIVWKI